MRRKGKEQMSDIPELNKELIRLGVAIELAADNYAELARDANVKRNDYDVAFMKALLIADGRNVEEKKAVAKLSCEALMREARTAEVFCDGMKERIRALTAALSAAQTRAALMKVEMSLAQYA